MRAGNPVVERIAFADDPDEYDDEPDERGNCRQRKPFQEAVGHRQFDIVVIRDAQMDKNVAKIQPIVRGR